MKCSICGKKITKLDSNNASPFDGECCNECNSEHVIPVRLALMKGDTILFSQEDDSYELWGDSDEAVPMQAIHSFIGDYIGMHAIPATDYVLLVNAEAETYELPVNMAWKSFEWSKLIKQPILGNCILIMKKNFDLTR